VGKDALIEQLRERFGKRAEGNIMSMTRAYDESVL
jgi:hypothetical protein